MPHTANRPAASPSAGSSPSSPPPIPGSAHATFRDALALHRTLLRWFSVPSPAVTTETFVVIERDCRRPS